MAKGEVARGEIWMFRFASPDRRRPVLVLSRPVLLQALHTATVAAITRTLHGSPTEVQLDIEEGLKSTSCVNLANVFTVQQSDLCRYVGVLSLIKMQDVCRALMVSCGCD